MIINSYKNSNKNSNKNLTKYTYYLYNKTNKKKGGIIIKVQTREIVSITDIIKNFKLCREKAEQYGKIFIWKNSQPDSVLYSMREYRKISPIIEYVESLDDKDFQEFIESLQIKKIKK